MSLIGVSPGLSHAPWPHNHSETWYIQCSETAYVWKKKSIWKALCGQYCHLALDNHLIADPPILNLTVVLKRVALHSYHSHHLSLTMVS